MSRVRLGQWLLLAWPETLDEPSEGRPVEFVEPRDAARLLTRTLALEGAGSLRCFVRAVDPGAPLGLDDRELVERLAGMIARRRVRLIDLGKLPICSEPVESIEARPVLAPHENVIEELEFVDWTVKLETDDPVWFEVDHELEEQPTFEVDHELEEQPTFEVGLV